jgi:flagellar hook-basal body complex protein FliE
MAIQPIQSNPISNFRELTAPQKSAASGSAQQIGETFENMLASLNQSQLNADGLVQQLAQGENVDLHTVMIGMEENNINFNASLII